jgi:hypothetical protein
MIEVKNTPEGILVNVSGSAKDLSNELRLLTKQIIKHPQLNRAFQASIYSAGGIDYINDLVEQYGIWVQACQTVDEMEAEKNDRR